MLAMTREKYIEVLQASTRINNPTDDQLAAVCPHLSYGQAVQALKARGYLGIALPPTKVRGSYRIAYTSEGNPVKGVAPYLSIRFESNRTPEAYADPADGRRLRNQPHDVPFVEEAIAYATQFWPEALVAVSWVDCLKIYIDNPADLYKGPLGATERRTLYIAALCLDRRWNDIQNDHNKSVVEQLESATVAATVNETEAVELLAGNGYGKYNCSRCGGGLTTSACTGCGIRYPTGAMTTGWGFPLTPTAIKLLRDAGHTFELPPERLYDAI